VNSRSVSLPYPFFTAQRAPLVSTRSTSRLETLILPFDPMPDGTLLYIAATRVFSTSCFRSARSSPVRSNLTPQLISYPTPPGDTTPFATSNAATPPIGNP
jgi:hypothetical protein